MSTVESILTFIISALLTTTAAIHGYVIARVYLDERERQKAKKLGRFGLLKIGESKNGRFARSRHQRGGKK